MSHTLTSKFTSHVAIPFALSSHMHLQFFHFTACTLAVLIVPHNLPPEEAFESLNERIRQYDSSDTGHSDNVNIAAEQQEPAEVLSQLDNTSNSPVYGEYKCC